MVSAIAILAEVEKAFFMEVDPKPEHTESILFIKSTTTRLKESTLLQEDSFLALGKISHVVLFFQLPEPWR